MDVPTKWGPVSPLPLWLLASSSLCKTICNEKFCFITQLQWQHVTYWFETLSFTHAFIFFVLAILFYFVLYIYIWNQSRNCIKCEFLLFKAKQHHSVNFCQHTINHNATPIFFLYCHTAVLRPPLTDKAQQCVSLFTFCLQTLFQGKQSRTRTLVIMSNSSGSSGRWPRGAAWIFSRPPAV